MAVTEDRVAGDVEDALRLAPAGPLEQLLQLAHLQAGPIEGAAELEQLLENHERGGAVVLSRQVMTRGVEPAALSCGHVLNEAPRTPEARERGLLAFLCPSGVDK